MINFLIQLYFGILNICQIEKKMIIKRSFKNESRWSKCFLIVGFDLENQLEVNFYIFGGFKILVQ